MTNRKFFAIVVFMLLLFASVFSAGCGGGGSGGSDNNVGVTSDDKTQENPTPTSPEPEPDPENLLTVTFDSNGGSTVTSQKVEEGATVNQPDDPTKDGNIFAGWYTDNNEFKNMFLFGDSGDIVTQDITLYAQWIEDNPDLYRVQFAVSQIVIGYSGGDNSEHVTKNLTLQKSVEGLENVTVTWTSDNLGIILTDGTVTRPQSDTDVTLTATVTSGSETQSREFNVTVIRKNTRVKTDISNNTVADIEDMNVSNDEFYIGYNDDKTQVINIEGEYSDIVIENAEDALDAVQNIHSVLGINDPYTELESSVVTSDTYGGEYTFQQVYNGIKVLGRSITVSANDSGKSDFLHSNFLATDKLTSANMNKSLTAEQAEEKALQNYSGSFDVLSNETELVIFSLQVNSADYENVPVYSYVVVVEGIDDEENYVNDSVFINAANGNLITKMSNLSYFYGNKTVIARGHNELGHEVSFDVLYGMDYTPQKGPVPSYDYGFHMHDPETNVKMYNISKRTSIMFYDNNSWDSDFSTLIFIPVPQDGQHISAYMNMSKIIRWWKDVFNRNSLDNKGMQVEVIVHKSLNLGDGLINGKVVSDNAMWMPIFNDISIYDKDKRLYSYAVALDVLTHETGHAVMQFQTGHSFWNNLFNSEKGHMAGSLSEGYADIFGCLIEGYDYDEESRSWTLKNAPSADAWKLGEIAYNNGCIRDASDPTAYEGLAHYSDYPVAYFPDNPKNNDIHLDGMIIPYSAYLMYEGGLSWQTLGQVWYKSLRLGLDPSSDFKDVRRCVVNAGRKLGLSSEQLDIIKNAFDEVGIEGASGRISGTVTAYDTGTAIRGAVVNGIQNAPVPFSARKVTTGSAGGYSLLLPYTRYKYLIDIKASGYVDFLAIQTVEEDFDKKMDVALVKSGKGSGSITVRSAINNEPLNGVILNLRNGWNMHPENSRPVRSGDVTNESGQFTFENINSGYYTVEMISDDYAPSYLNITVAPNATTTQNGYLSPLLSGNDYRVVLSWGANPSDLDSHLTGRHPNGSFAHVYFRNKSGSVNGKAINLDRDDTDSYGPETTTFEVDTESNYEFYVYWYAGTGTWQGSQGVVNVYNGGRHVAVFTVPEVNSASPRYWSVFKITRGIFAPVNELVSNEPNP